MPYVPTSFDRDPVLRLTSPSNHLPRFDGGGALCCPGCGFDYLHHDTVIAFQRQGGEDSPSTAIVAMGAVGNLTNPSSRRGAVMIGGWCEGCESRWVLRLIQHKGMSYVDVVPWDMAVGVN